jgi:hypothetical protein
MSDYDSGLQARLESQAKALPTLTGPEKRGFRDKVTFIIPPPEGPPPNIPGLDFGKPQEPAVCPLCGAVLGEDTKPTMIDGQTYWTCRKCS